MAEEYIAVQKKVRKKGRGRAGNAEKGNQNPEQAKVYSKRSRREGKETWTVREE